MRSDPPLSEHERPALLAYRYGSDKPTRGPTPPTRCSPDPQRLPGDGPT